MNIYTIEELQKDLKVSRNTVLKLIKNGEIQAIKVGTQYRIPEENVKRFISNATLPTMKPTGHLEDFVKVSKK